MLKVYLTFILFFFNGIMGQTEVVILSENVGTDIDNHENRFYRIFSHEKGLVDGQLAKIEDKKYALHIVKKIDGKLTKVRRYFSQEEFDELKDYADSQPVMTKEAKIAMYKGMNFLRAEKIIKEMPKPQHVSIKYMSDKKISGTFFKTENNIFYSNPSAIERIDLNVVDILSYRSEIGDFDNLKSIFNNND